jgi:hypothetical protein
MGKWQHGDMCLLINRDVPDFCCMDCLKNLVYSSRIYNKALRIPKPIDWQNPERGLWGMIKKGVNKQIEETDAYCFVWIDSVCFEATDPFTALLMALCVQEGV